MSCSVSITPVLYEAVGVEVLKHVTVVTVVSYTVKIISKKLKTATYSMTVCTFLTHNYIVCCSDSIKPALYEAVCVGST